MRGPDCTRRVATCAPTPCMQHSIGVPGMAAMRGRPPRCAGASLRRAQATACAYLWPALHELGRELLEQLLHPLFLQVLGVRRSTTGRHPRSPTAPRRSASARGAAAAHPRRSGGSVGRSVGRSPSAARRAPRRAAGRRPPWRVPRTARGAPREGGRGGQEGRAARLSIVCRGGAAARCPPARPKRRASQNGANAAGPAGGHPRRPPSPVQTSGLWPGLVGIGMAAP